MLSIAASCVIRRIVTYHYIRPIWIMILSLIIKERRCKKPLLRQASQRELWGRSRFFNDETQKNRKQHALRG